MRQVFLQGAKISLVQAPATMQHQNAVGIGVLKACGPGSLMALQVRESEDFERILAGRSGNSLGTLRGRVVIHRGRARQVAQVR